LESGPAPSFDLIAAAAHERALVVSRRDDESLWLEGQLHVDPLALKPLLDWAVEVAEAANADFDGWECGVIQRKN